MKPWSDLVRRVLDTGEFRPDRTGVGTLSVFGGHMQFDLRERFPLVQAKETRWKVAFLEMLWFLRGDCHTQWLKEHGCKLWDAWADEHGLVGAIYGWQWRRWEANNGRETDQVRTLIDGIRENPDGRRHIVSAWNVGELDRMALPPCHWAHQAYASNDGHLDLMVHQRSWDLALGAPFNLAAYALLLTLYARATNRKPRYLHYTYGDAHVYVNHIDAMREVLAREFTEDRARLVITTDNTDIDGYKPEDFDIEGYEPQPFVKLPVAV